MPVPLFLNDVLPYAVMSEPRGLPDWDWRPKLTSYLLPLIKDMPNASAVSPHKCCRPIASACARLYSAALRVEPRRTATARLTSGSGVARVVRCLCGVPRRPRQG